MSIIITQTKDAKKTYRSPELEVFEVRLESGLLVNSKVLNSLGGADLSTPISLSGDWGDYFD